jgi:hypothetical protein
LISLEPTESGDLHLVEDECQREQCDEYTTKVSRASPVTIAYVADGGVDGVLAAFRARQRGQPEDARFVKSPYGAWSSPTMTK